MVQEITQAIGNARDCANINARWPIKEAIIHTKDKELINAASKLKDIISKQTNVKEVKISDKFDNVEIIIKPNYKTLGQEYGKLAPEIMKTISKEDSKVFYNKLMESGIKLKIKGKSVLIEQKHINVERNVKAPYVAGECSLCGVYIDTTRTKELDNEGYAREIMRRVQVMRKENGLEKKDMIKLVLPTNVEEMLKQYEEEITRKCGAIQVIYSNVFPEIRIEFKIKSLYVTIGIEKV